MNCRSLSRLLLHADPGQKDGARALLAQLSSDLEVILSGEKRRVGEAAVSGIL